MALTYKALAVLLAYPTADTQELAEAAIQRIRGYAGNPAALHTCLTAVKRGGRVIQVGTLPAELPFPANSVMQRELDYRGVFRAHLGLPPSERA